MVDEPTDFRDRLLGAQQMEPGLREAYRRELSAILNHKLTPRTRALTWVALLASLAAAVLCVWSAVVHRGKQDVLMVLPAYAAVAALTAGWFAVVLRRGGFSRRASFAMVEWLGGSFVAVFLTVALLRGMQAPGDPRSTFSLVMGVLVAMVGFAWGTGNRIAAATLETREHLLRLESRLADLADRLPK